MERTYSYVFDPSRPPPPPRLSVVLSCLSAAVLAELMQCTLCHWWNETFQARFQFSGEIENFKLYFFFKIWALRAYSGRRSCRAREAGPGPQSSAEPLGSAEPFFNKLFTMRDVLQNLPAEPQRFCKILGNLWEAQPVFSLVAPSAGTPCRATRVALHVSHLISWILWRFAGVAPVSRYTP